MKNLICPTSTERLSHQVVRLTGLMMAGLLLLYLWTGSPWFIWAAVIDYTVRAFSLFATSPFSWLAAQIVGLLGWQIRTIDKAPKIFAARVGWLFAFLGALLIGPFPILGVALILTLMTFALLESIIDFCMGCVIYTYLVFPYFGENLG